MTVSVAIIGGGISGLGAALAAQKRGWSVTIFERDHIGCGASGNSLRIVHGGFRYLQHFDLPRIVRSLRDQERIRLLAPDQVRRLPCWMPLRRFGVRTRLPMIVATQLYRCIGKAAGVATASGSIVGRSEVAECCADYLPCAPYGVFAWDDLLLCDPLGFMHSLSAQLRAAQVVIHEQRGVRAVHRQGERFAVELTDGESPIFERVINCAGAWIDDASNDAPRPMPARRWVAGFNLVWNRRLFETPRALGFESPDGRLFFLLQRDSDVALGTGYVGRDRGAFHAPDARELDAFLNAARRAWPRIPIGVNEPDTVEWGILPRAGFGGAEPEPQGNYEIRADGPHRCSVVSTKFTTFLSQGEAAVRQVLSL